jgi:hypothetical protein
MTNSEESSFPVMVGPDLSFNGGSRDAFVTKVNASGTSIAYCGYIGGEREDNGYDIALDDRGNAYITGDTRSDEKSFPVKGGPDLTFNGESDAFAAKVTASGASLDFCGYIGGSGQDLGSGIAVDSRGNAHVIGDTTSGQHNGFPVQSGPDLTFNGLTDAFVAKISMALVTDSHTLSEQGGTINFFLEAGAGSGNRNYVLLGTVSGTTPGTPLPGGTVTLPLNWDLFTNLVIDLINTSIFDKFMGILDADGSASAKMNLGTLPPGYVGTVMHFAYGLNTPWDFASNPVAIEIVP